MSTVLGQLLKSRRELLGYSRTRAAELSGVNASSIEAWEVGRVAKPPIHDVIRLARALEIPIEELERAVIEDEQLPLGGDRPARPRARAEAAAGGVEGVGLPLLTRALAVLGWSDPAAAQALSTSKARIGRLRRGEEDLSVLEVMTLIAMLAAFPSVEGGASQPEVDDLLARLRAPLLDR